MRADKGVSVFCSFRGNLAGFTRGFGQQLRLAGAIHGNEPPSGFVDGVADGEQAMVAQNGGFLRSQSVSNAVALRGFFDEARVIVEQDVIVEKSTGILREGVEKTAQRGPGLSIKGMRVSGGNHVRARRVNARVNGEGGALRRVRQRRVDVERAP